MTKFQKYFFLIMAVIWGCIIFLATATWSNSWDDYLKHDWENVQLLDGEGIIFIDAPYRAVDGSNVPVTIGTLTPDFVKLTVIVDENPTPCCATFEFEGIPAQVATNIRINAYTNIRVIGETRMGEHYMTTKFIKSAGGCSAPAIGAESRPRGSMEFEETATNTTVQIWHPNYSGMQFNQLTRTEIPAEYISNLSVVKDGVTVFRYEGLIGIAENTYFKLPFVKDKSIEVYAEDNLGNQFKFNSLGF